LVEKTNVHQGIDYRVSEVDLLQTQVPYLMSAIVPAR
jgi:hypothetical protein